MAHGARRKAAESIGHRAWRWAQGARQRTANFAKMNLNDANYSELRQLINANRITPLGRN
jgi:hypothetical protein